MEDNSWQAFVLTTKDYWYIADVAFYVQYDIDFMPIDAQEKMKLSHGTFLHVSHREPRVFCPSKHGLKKFFEKYHMRKKYLINSLILT
ncbi:hypothetical protein NC653_001817 [Populus alba x Populus x berolinensis]|uniref:Uncharacterized protein n=1 Tax=Populus alba x Populus x berolinensis TaxID=444605 RepID=A0AAD6WFZ5_9ROSI|nr:hypothetical protein NC653_001817 [Populus alba x Populus x berolinensis]